MTLKPKHRRAILILVAGIILTVMTVLVTSALRDNLLYFYYPSQIPDDVGTRPIRVGGLVQKGSIVYLSDASVQFTIEDDTARVIVIFTGLLPDLFREGQGVILDGSFEKPGVIRAKRVLAKHDENYTPPGSDKALKLLQQKDAE